VTDSERVQEALARYLEYLEMGGAEPDFSDLADDDRRELQELIDALELTEGVAFGRGGREGSPKVEATTAAGEQLLVELRASLPPDVRLEADESRLIAQLGAVALTERFVVGTFGGRVRVWLLDVDEAGAVDDDPGVRADLARVFRMLPDTSGLALVGRDLSCLIVEPEDTAPRIQVPSGSLAPRRYKRALASAAQAVPAFLDELTPYWGPMPEFDPGSIVRVDVAEVSSGPARGTRRRTR
jgi:hypothetical protein